MVHPVDPLVMIPYVIYNFDLFQFGSLQLVSNLSNCLMYSCIAFFFFILPKRFHDSHINLFNGEKMEGLVPVHLPSVPCLK